MDYYVTYRPRPDLSVSAQHTLEALNAHPAPSTLEEVIESCTYLAVEAELFDEAGFRKGWVHADGSYTLQ